MLSLLDSRSTSDHMATPVSRSLPDGIGQGHRPMSDHLASAIWSLFGDNTGHDMTGTSPGTLITVTGLVRSPVRSLITGPVTGHLSGPVTGLVIDHRSGHRTSHVTGPVRSCHRSSH
ncbi:hypothetical protein DPMN_140072 [Dreissena polymorpha]|uniref:Uncharacterized protein n=1 Tax=Dreissena polymorpha TaxID=45954 RepID=A0A9D4G6X4_DREPO|nr:hypothetical protein DPMN_140072 [Dreissena polymorpha]